MWFYKRGYSDDRFFSYKYIVILKSDLSLWVWLLIVSLLSMVVIGSWRLWHVCLFRVAPFSCKGSFSGEATGISRHCLQPHRKILSELCPLCFKHSVHLSDSGQPRWRLSESQSEMHLCLSCHCLLLSSSGLQTCLPRVPSHTRSMWWSAHPPGSWEAKSLGHQHSRNRRLLRFFYSKQNKKPHSSLPIGCNFPVFSCLTKIFLSTASAERCKINFGKAWVEMIWLPENKAELGERANFPASAG